MQNLLSYKQFGESGFPLLILHGLFGSGSNWQTLAKAYQAKGLQVFALDARNHGHSFHTPGMAYREMAGDVIQWMDALQIPRCHVLGHSMGGKTAIQMGSLFPDRIEKIIVADIAPVTYSPHHDDVFQALEAVNNKVIRSRDEADKEMAVYLPDAMLRLFLLKNLVRTEEGGFAWGLGLSHIRDGYSQILAAPDQGLVFEGACLCVRGGLSSYVTPSSQEAFGSYFRSLVVKTIENAGHWLHAESPEKFLELTCNFLL